MVKTEEIKEKITKKAKRWGKVWIPWITGKESRTDIKYFSHFSPWFNSNCFSVIICEENRKKYRVDLWIYEEIFNQEQEINEKNIHSIKISIEQYLDEAKARVKLIEERLQGRSEEKYEKHPILSLLEIKEGNPIYFSDVVKKKNVDKEEVCSNSTAHLKKHDIIAVRINSTLNYHVAVYRGGSIKTKEIAHIPDAKGSPAKFDTLDNFLENRNAERIILHRLIIPFKKPEEIENSINVAIDKKKYGKGKYNLITRNCEHFATLCVTGVKFSSQVKNLLDLNFKLNKEKINEKVLSEDNFIAQVEKASPPIKNL